MIIADIMPKGSNAKYITYAEILFQIHYHPIPYLDSHFVQTVSEFIQWIARYTEHKKKHNLSS